VCVDRYGEVRKGRILTLVDQKSLASNHQLLASNQKLLASGQKLLLLGSNQVNQVITSQ
jgi:hypothetical protein